MIPDLPRTVAERIAHFSGRTWLLPKIVEWFTTSDKRTLLVTGGPGTGKSMVLAWLAGAGPLPADDAARAHLLQIRAWAQAAHFCLSGGVSSAPKAFADNVSRQLTRNVPGFGAALTDTLADLVRITSTQTIGTVSGGTVTGVKVELNLGGLEDEPAFNRAFRMPLQKLYEGGYAQPLLLLVDALDESETYSGSDKLSQLLAHLDELPPQVRVLATTRPDPRVLKNFRGAPALDLIADAPNDADDVRQYAFDWLSSLDDVRRAQLAQRIATVARGNFLYAYLVIADADLLPRVANAPDLSQLALPNGLSGIYADFLNRELGKDDDRWYETFRPLLGLIAVAQGDGLTLAQLKAISGQKDNVEPTLRKCAQYLHGDLPNGPFRLFHKSFADFLLDDPHNLDRDIDARAMHAAIAAYYLDAARANGDEAAWAPRDDYDLRYLPTHLAHAAQISDKTIDHQQVERLVRVMANANFQRAHQAHVNDLAALLRDMESALRLACADSDARALPLIVAAALSLVAFRRAALQAEPIFALALKGDIAAAQQRLSLFVVEREWQLIALLTIAWLAAQARPAQARTLRDQAVAELGNRAADDPFRILLARLAVDLDGAAMPPLQKFPAPPPPLVREIVARMGGMARGGEGIEGMGTFDASIGGMAYGDEAPVFIAQRDAPLLAAYADAGGPDADRLTSEYVRLHAQNQYAQYRNNSLWTLLAPFLQHHDPQWARDTLRQIATVALAGTTAICQDGLRATVWALRARAGAADAQQSLTELVNNETDSWHQAVASPDSDDHDSWGNHKRRWAALAETFARALNRPADADDALNKIFGFRRGFAGFQSPAWLAVADAVRVCVGDDPHSADALARALESAHNVQDPTFCARTTSRVNALTAFAPAPIAQTARRFAANPRDAEFAARHILGEKYRRRDHERDKLSLDAIRNARSLNELVDVYRQPLAEFVRLNPNVPVDVALANDSSVNVPDPDFAPQVAAHLSAAVLTANDIADAERVALLRSLVPIAVADATALDAVLSRLVLAADRAHALPLDALADTVTQHTIANTTDERAGAETTARLGPA
ncbi:MAG: hypothetical protein ABI874_05580 [Chloroflexota bacterium]